MVETDSQTDNSCAVTETTTEAKRRIISNRSETNGALKKIDESAPAKTKVIFKFISFSGR